MSMASAAIAVLAGAGMAGVVQAVVSGTGGVPVSGEMASGAMASGGGIGADGALLAIDCVGAVGKLLFASSRRLSLPSFCMAR